MFRKMLVAVTAAAALLLAPTVAQAAPPPAPTPTVEPGDVLRPVRPVLQPRLVDVRFARHRGFDRLVFDFRGGVPEADFRYVRRVRLDPSDRPVFVPGRAFLLLRFEPARARSFPRGVQFTDLANVRGFRLVGDFEGVVTVAVGLRNRVGVRVFELPGRVVVDIPNRVFYRTL